MLRGAAANINAFVLNVKLIRLVPRYRRKASRVLKNTGNSTICTTFQEVWPELIINEAGGCRGQLYTSTCGHVVYFAPSAPQLS